jgi:opacity protein-like surface antigen
LGARSVLLILSVLLIPFLAVAQVGHSDVTLSALGNFPFHSESDSIATDATNAGGFAVNYRLYFKAHSAIEFGYGFTRSTFYYAVDETDIHGGIISLTQGSNMHELIADYVYHFWPDRRFQPFVLAGGGTVIFKPSGSANASTLFGATTQARGAYVYGGGLDYHLSGPFTLRMQYRALNFKVPDFYGSGLTTHGWMRTSAPQIGVTYKF